MTGIVREATLAQVRSFATQTPASAALLESSGKDVLVFWCSGYIFFGTASTILKQIEEKIESLESCCERVASRFICTDSR